MVCKSERRSFGPSPDFWTLDNSEGRGTARDITQFRRYNTKRRTKLRHGTQLDYCWSPQYICRQRRFDSDQIMRGMSEGFYSRRFTEMIRSMTRLIIFGAEFGQFSTVAMTRKPIPGQAMDRPQ